MSRPSEFARNIQRLRNRIENRLRRGFRKSGDGDYWLSRVRFLPSTLEYTGEFGFELVLFLPFVTWLSQVGLLANRKIKTYRGMTSFYQDLGHAGLIEKDIEREFVRPRERLPYLPIKDEHAFKASRRSAFMTFPDLRQAFQNDPLTAEFELEIARKPLVIVHNKYTNEWREGPVNHISTDTLSAMFSELTPHFTVVYIRHGIAGSSDTYVGDHNDILAFDDRKVLEAHPQVHLFDDLFRDWMAVSATADINRFKNILCSRCHRFITTQGGGAHHLAYFSGSLMIVLHRRGDEELGAYTDGFYSFISNPAPLLACCRTEEELMSAVPVILGSKTIGGRIVVEPTQSDVLERLSPWTLAGRT